MPINCPYCDFQNDDDAVWCAKCNCNMIDWSSGDVKAGETVSDDTPDEPNDRLWTSIFITIFCCQILGIIAMIYSVIARVEKERGNNSYALSASRSADKWIVWSFWIGILTWTLLLVAKTITYNLGGSYTY